MMHTANTQILSFSRRATQLRTLSCDDLLWAAATLTLAQGMLAHSDEPPRVDLTAEEPLIYSDGAYDIVEVVKRLKAEGYEVRLNTNGYLLSRYASDLAAAGLDVLRLHLDTVDQADYLDITGIDGLHRVLDGIRAALASGLKVKLNRVLLPDKLGDMSTYLDYLEANSLVAKFLDLHWSTPNAGDAGEIIARVLEHEVLPRVVTRPFVKDSRNDAPRIIYQLCNEAAVEVRLPLGARIAKLPFCRSCPLVCRCVRTSCLLPTSLKLMPDLRVEFCSVRHTPHIELAMFRSASLRPAIAALEVACRINEVFEGEAAEFLPLVIRAVIWPTCNLRCRYCHADGWLEWQTVIHSRCLPTPAST